MIGDSMGMDVFGSYMYNGQEIAERGNIIFVSVAYRLGPLGFLSTGDSALPGKSNSNLISAHLQMIKGSMKYFTFSERHETL